MTTYEMCKQIRNRIMISAAEVINYNWDADFATEELRKRKTKILEDDQFKQIDPSDLTSEEMDDLGFGTWSDENPMRLIPLWLFPFLVDLIEAECINGEKKIYLRTEMDGDHRFGCIAYGVRPKDAISQD